MMHPLNRIGVAFLGLMALGISGSALAQDGDRTNLMVSGGGGIVVRSERHATSGYLAGVGVVRQVSPGLSLRLEASWQSFAPWQFSSGAPCPPGGCPVRNDNRTNLAGLALNAQYRKVGVGNPLYPVLGVGLYRFSEGQRSSESLSVNAGLGIGLGALLAIEGRYHAILADLPAEGLVALSLVGTFR